MANTLTSVTPKLLAQGLRALRENAILPQVVNRRFEALAGERGSTIDVPIPSAIAAAAVAPGAVPVATADIAPTSVPVSLNQWFETPFYLTDQDMMEAMDGLIPMQASEAIKSLANNVDAYILGLYTKFFGYTGTAGTTPFAGGTPTTVDATSLRTVLNKQLAPLNDRHVIMDPDAEGNALNVRAFQDASFSGDVRAIIDGNLNNKLGFQWWMDQNVPTHTAGAAASYLVNSASVAIGDKTIAVDTGTGAFNVGDIITFAGHTQTYVITATTAAPATSITIEPGAQIAIADNAAITSKADHVVNLGIHRDAIAFATRPLAMHGSELGVISQSAIDPISGLTLRLEITHEHKRVRFSYDILYGAEVVRRELGARLAG